MNRDPNRPEDLEPGSCGPQPVPIVDPGATWTAAGRAGLPKSIGAGGPDVQDRVPAVPSADASVPAAQDPSLASLPAPVVHRYTRGEALADGVLFDVSREASPAEMASGFAIPVAITAALQDAIETIPASLAGIADARGRLHDVLWMAACAAWRHRGTDRATFQVLLPCRGTRKRMRELLLHVGPDDDGRPWVTIGFPEDF